MAIPKFASAYNPPVSEGTDCSGDPIITKQEFKEECDINNIMKRYERTGELPPDIGLGTFGDFYDAPDFREAQEILVRAGTQFAALPAAVRAEFMNDPGKMLEFIGGIKDSEGFKKAKSLGLLKDEAVDPFVVVVPAVPSAVPAVASAVPAVPSAVPVVPGK